MDRPPSAANSLPSSTAASHKRAQSIGNAPKHNAITLFVRNVRLLDLDLLPDWPRVTPTSLCQDARTRIRGAEWCLYQLFRIHDPATTADKLQPFFPPLEPLQSINLRAALYRCLNDLKKNGVLAKETVVRKSMLDDCQGDKFWELCLAFSTTVLRKLAADKQTSLHRPLAEVTGNAHALTKGQRESMLPLAVAHKAALTRILSQKARKKRTLARLYDVLVDKENDLEERKAQAREQPHSHSHDTSLAEEVLEKDWIGSNDLRDALRNGDQAGGGDSLLIRPFDSVWNASEQDRLFTPDPSEIGILEDLEHRARFQKRRLQRWQGFHERLLSRNPPPSRNSDTSARSSELRFDQHQNLTFRDVVDNPQALPPLSRHQKHDSVMKYDEILTAMREELRKNSAAAVRAEPPDPEIAVRSRTPSYRRPSATHEAVTGAIDHHHRSHSQTAVPVRPPFGKRVSSRSRSYHQPKVISQREPIPLKSEIFSPLKTRRTSTSPASSGRVSVLASPMEETLPDEQIQDVINAATNRISQNSDYGASAASALETTSHSARGSGASTPMSTRSGGENPDSAVELPPKASTVGVAGRNIDGHSRTMRPSSLADRTRMSMAFKSAEDVDQSPAAGVGGPNQGNAEAADLHIDSPDPSDPSSNTLARRPTLHDRTRQSISLAPAHSAPLPPKSKKPTHARSHTTAAFPVNQFETPPRASAPRRSTLTVDASVGDAPLEQATRRSITPREKLFDQDAEYASIFKARPKVALSPVMSPSPFTTEFPSDDVDALVGEGSPLVGRHVQR